MHVVSALKPLGLASVIALTAGLSFLIAHWPQGKNATFSKHAAAQRITITYYIALFALALPLLLLFFIYWFAPTFHLSFWFIIFAIVSELLQHSVTLIPELEGWRARWHKVLTSISAAFLPLMLVLILIAHDVASPEKITTAVGLFIMLSIATYHGLHKAQPHDELILQAAYYGAFFAVIMALTYTNR